MLAEILRPLVGLITVLVGLEALMLAKWRVRGDLPLIALLSAIASVGLYTFIAAPEGLVWPLIPLSYGLLLQPLSFVAAVAATIARVRGAYSVARWLHVPSVIFRPGHRAVITQRVLGILARWKAGKLNRSDADVALHGLLERIRSAARPANANYLATAGLLLRAARVELVAREGYWELLGEELTAETAQAIGMPCNADAAWKVRALCELGRLEEAARLVAVMERGAELRSPSQLERFAYLNRARVTLSAFCGHRELVEDALARGSQVRPVFAAAERQNLIDIAQQAPPTTQVSAPTAAAVKLASRLPTAFSTLLSPAPTTLALVLANILLYLPVTIWGSPYDPMHLLHVGGLQSDLVAQGDVWRLLSSMFIHAGSIHLLFNCALLLVLGNDIENLLGRKSFALLYLISGLAGGVAALIFSEHSVVVGASGAVFGLLGAVVVTLFSIRLKVPKQWYRRRFSAYVVLVAVNTFLGLSIEFVSFSAHAGGFVAGLVGALVALQVRGWTSPTLSRIGTVLCIALWVGLVGWTVPMVAASVRRPALDVIPMRTVTFTSERAASATMRERAVWEIEVPVFWTEPPEAIGEGSRPLLIGSAAMLVRGNASCQVHLTLLPESGETVSGFTVVESVDDEIIWTETSRGWPDGKRLHVIFAFREDAGEDRRALLERMLNGARVVSCEESSVTLFETDVVEPTP